MKPIFCIVLLLGCIQRIQTYKILVYSPQFASSHVNFMGTIADVLVQGGHDVVVYQPHYNVNITNPGTKLAKLFIRPLDFQIPFPTNQQNTIWNPKEPDYYMRQGALKTLSDSFATLCKYQIIDDKIMNQIKSENFDLAIGEIFDACFYAILKRIQLQNYITAFSNALFPIAASHLGIPATPSFLHDNIFRYVMFEHSSPPLTYIGRVKGILNHVLGYNLFPKFFFGNIEEIARPVLGQDFDVMSMVRESSLIFANVDEHIDFPRPVSHKIVYIGGIGQAKPKALEQKYQQLMDNSQKGVILVSFGSIALSYQMLDEQKQTLLSVFKEFPDITFLWKYEKEDDNFTTNYKNLVIGKWLPQADLLNHPKMLAFITHGGVNSIMESVTRGVPLICIPLFADQSRNALAVEYRKVGISTSKGDLMNGKEKLVQAIKSILDDPSYHKNVKRLSEMVKSKPMKPEERLLKYSEFAAQFGFDNNLDMYGRNLNTVEYYCLDIILPLLVSILIVLYLVYSVLGKFVKFVSKLFLFSNVKNKSE